MVYFRVKVPHKYTLNQETFICNLMFLSHNVEYHTQQGRVELILAREHYKATNFSVGEYYTTSKYLVLFGTSKSIDYSAKHYLFAHQFFFLYSWNKILNISANISTENLNDILHKYMYYGSIWNLFVSLDKITGGGKGIGRAICQALAAEGADIVTCALHQEGLDETLASLPKGTELTSWKKWIMLLIIS